MKRERKIIAYSFEHGDKSLPCLKDLISDKEDPEKSRILSYLRMNCIAASPGIVVDEINPERYIGCGNLFSDGTYVWDDVFINYVERYNIPVPDEVRAHILENFNARMKRHCLLRLIDRIEVVNAPDEQHEFSVQVYSNGDVLYKNVAGDSFEKMHIDPNDAKYIIDPIMSDLFCYDSDEHGEPKEGGYHWKITFYKGDKVVDTVEGRPGEDDWRRKEFLGRIEFMERYIPVKYLEGIS